MFENMRQKIKGFITVIIIAMIACAFAFLGVIDYFSFGRNETVAAKVNGENISWQTIDTLYERAQRQMGDKVDARALKDQLLQVMVHRTALLNKAKTMGFKVGDTQIVQTLVQIPAFQIDGKFSKDKYIEEIGKVGYNDPLFRNELAQDLLLAQLEQGVMQSSFTLTSEFRQLMELLDQRRDIGFMQIPIQKSKEEATPVTKEEAEAYYDKHQVTYVVPEQVSLQFVELSLDTIAKGIQVNDQDIKDYYEEHKASYSAPERVHVRHILIGFKNPSASNNGEGNDKEAKAKEATKGEEANTRDRAVVLMDKLKSGADFETIAKENSDDKMSAEKGGDLGWFTKGQMVPEFERAAFALKNSNELAGPIRTSFGYHIIQLLDHKPAETRALAEVHDLVKEQLQREKAQAVFLEQGERLAKLAFEQASDLAPIKDQLGLKIEETELFSRQGGRSKITSNPALIQTAFSDEVVKQGINSEPISLDDTTMVVVRLKKHEPSKQQTFAEVEKRIQAQLALEKSILKSKKLVDSLVKRLQAGENPNEIAKENGVTWTQKKDVARNNTELDRNIVTLAFQTARSDSENKPGVKSMRLPSGEYLIMAVTDVRPGNIDKIDENTKQQYQQGIADVLGQMEFSLFANQVLNKSKIELSDQK